jgi:hypothetical protein
MSPSQMLAADDRRLVLRLLGGAPLDQELGEFGTGVARRSDVQANGRMRQRQRENFCLRLLLIAWERLGALKRPVSISAPQGGSPDFTLCRPGESPLGLEVTQSGSEVDQRAMFLRETSESGEAELLPGDGYVGHAHDRVIADEVERVIRAKLDARHARPAHLIVYENSDAGFVGDKHRIAADLQGRRVLAKDVADAFDEVHLILGSLVLVDLLGAARAVDLSKAYEVDYAAWIDDQVETLRKGARSEVDAVHVAEELADLGKSERRQIESHLTVLMMHLLKWQFQPTKRSKSWQLTIRNARREIDRAIARSPSLRPYAEAYLATAYWDGRENAVIETGLNHAVVPAACPYSLEQALNLEFLPG